MKKIVAAISMTLMFAGNALAETNSLWSGKPTENGSAFTEGETFVAGVVVLAFIIFLHIQLWRLMWCFLKNGHI